MKYLLLFSLLICLVIFTGCATIITGTTQNISFTSDPTGAKVSVGGMTGTTPTVLTLNRNGSLMVNFEKQGYLSTQITLSRGFEPMFLGNIIIGGLIGMAIDFVSGAVFKLSPEHVNATLAPEDSFKYSYKRIGTLIITSNVDGSEVYVDGKFIGNVPATIKLEAGEHSVEVRKQGYKKYIRDMNILPDSEVTFNAELIK